MSKKTITRFLIILILNSQFSILNSYAAPSVWKDGEFLLWSHGKQYLSPSDFCFALRYENEKIGTPICTYAGDWERDSTTALYAKWLNTNLDSRLNAEDLRPRNGYVIEKMQFLKDKNLLFSTIKNDKVWFLLFDETSLEPIKIASFSTIQDSAKIARTIASDWFGSTPQRRLSDSEREAKQREPDEYFAEQPMHDFWVGANLGYNRAKVPLTPNSWYKNKIRSKIKNYRIPVLGQAQRDSVSAWNFIDDSTPIYNVYMGGSLYDFIGLEFVFRRSTHEAKIENDPIYNELSNWKFNRYEFLLSLMFMKVFKPIPQIEIEPYASSGLLYSFFTENISHNDDYEESNQYKERFEFETYYRGVALTIGLRTAFFKNYAIDFRTGIANRGAATSNRSVIGSSTTDVFVSTGLEYHFRWK